MNRLFEGFLDDSGTYRAAQVYWERLFLSSLPHIFIEKELKIQYANNEDNDGNPIFSATCLPLELAVRVIQQPVGDADDLDLDCWIDSVSLKPGVEIKELVISCCLSEENQPDVKRILRNWFTKGKVVAAKNPDEVRRWEGRTLSYSPELCLH